MNIIILYIVKHDGNFAVSTEVDKTILCTRHLPIFPISDLTMNFYFTSLLTKVLSQTQHLAELSFF